MKQFFLHHYKGGRPEFSPELPDGLPSHMLTYFQFYRDKDWHPRWVDRLYDDELYWLPVMDMASNDAEAAWSEIQNK